MSLCDLYDHVTRHLLDSFSSMTVVLVLSVTATDSPPPTLDQLKQKATDLAGDIKRMHASQTKILANSQKDSSRRVENTLKTAQEEHAALQKEVEDLGF